MVPLAASTSSNGIRMLAPKSPLGFHSLASWCQGTSRPVCGGLQSRCDDQKVMFGPI